MNTEISRFKDYLAKETPILVPSRWQRILHWEYLGLCLIIALTLSLHFIAINHPNGIVWDETYYVKDAQSIINGTGDTQLEHPPLAKLLVVAGMLTFGDNAFGWRFFSVIFGTIGIVLFYFICRKLQMSSKATLIATFLFALDDMSFIHAGLALLYMTQ